ncbi:MAG: ABC transporter permease subunit [Hyphomicrobiaceae bacterium]|nr:MAG: ABC transporter permease subunit [Hyphomicrobiaceae bacterium]
MLFYVLLRVAAAIAAYVGLAFLLALVSTVDPAQILTTIPQQPRALDPPLASKLASILAGQFGVSRFDHQPVSSLIAKSLGATIGTACVAALIASVIALPLGIAAGRIRGSIGDTALLRITLLLEAPPIFWVALLLVVLGVQLGLLPASAAQGGAGLVIPVLAFAAAIVPILMRRTRQGVAELAASEGGASGGRILIICVSALLAGLLAAIGWAVAAEPILDSAGAGRLLYQAIVQRDVPLFSGALMTLGAAAIAIALISDVLRAAAGLGGHRQGFSHELAHHGETEGAPRLASVGFILGAFLLLALVGLSFLADDPNQLNLTARLRPVASPEHLLGTDVLGRDVLARACVALRWSIGLGLLVAALATVLGAVLGTIGTLSSFTATLIRVLIEARFSLPLLLVAVAVVSVFQPGLLPIAAVLGLGLSDGPAAATLTARYPLPARAIQHQPPPAPNGFVKLTGPWLAAFFHSAASAIVLFETTNFLGLAIAPPTATFGGMLETAARFASTNPGLTYVPGLILVALVLSLLLMADGLRSTSARGRR